MIGRLLSLLSPQRLHEDASMAEAEALESQTVMEVVEAQEATVQGLAARMKVDRDQNQYALRVALAMGRDHA